MSLPTPDRITWELHEVREKLDAIEEGYADLYDASLRPRSGGSLGKIGGTDTGSDPTGDAATNGNQAMLRSRAGHMAGRIRVIRRVASEALDAHDEGWQQLPGGTQEEEREKRRERKREWMERWADLKCGCSQHESGQWIVSRECSEHMQLIPLEQRIPFSQIRLHGAKFGPFQPPRGARREDAMVRAHGSAEHRMVALGLRGGLREPPGGLCLRHSHEIGDTTMVEAKQAKRSVRIVGDGTATGTRIYDAESGEELERVTTVSWSHTAAEMPTATVEMILPRVDVVAEAVVTRLCQWCGKPEEGLDTP